MNNPTASSSANNNGRPTNKATSAPERNCSARMSGQASINPVPTVMTVTTHATSPKQTENKKRLFPSRTNSFHGSTTAARLRTTPSRNINLPRLRIQVRTRPRARNTRKNNTTSAMTSAISGVDPLHHRIEERPEIPVGAVELVAAAGIEAAFTEVSQEGARTRMNHLSHANGRNRISLTRSTACSIGSTTERCMVREWGWRFRCVRS